MGQQIYKVPRLTDRQIQHILQTMAEEFGAFGMNMSVSDHGLGKVNFPSQTEPIWQSLLATESELLSQFSVIVRPAPSLRRDRRRCSI